MHKTNHSKDFAEPGEISADSIYTLEAIKQRLGLGAAALRSARRAGLRVRRIGRRGYVLGRDFLDFIESDGEQQ